MFYVKTPDEVTEIIRSNFIRRMTDVERIAAKGALGCVLSEDIVSMEYVPGFNRSAVDGYAVIAAHTFGCSESIPAILMVSGEIRMGEPAGSALSDGCCMSIPTGGEVPDGADSVVMLEHTEDYHDGTIGILRPLAPGDNMVFRGDDVTPGDVVLRSGTALTAHDIGTLAALGITDISVAKKTAVGIISTGDEIVDAGAVPKGGQIRDVNTSLLAASVISAGALPVVYGIINDDDTALDAVFSRALGECDIVLISGGSSVGKKDATARIMQGCCEMLLHGIAMKPGKPTILGKSGDKAVFGLPGHPVAAYIVTQLFVIPLIDIMMGRARRFSAAVRAEITEAVPANHGRAEYVAVKLQRSGDTMFAAPVRSKSGLIMSLSDTDGYLCVPRDCEGLARGASAEVILWR